MNDNSVVIYISNGSDQCEELLNQMDKWNINYIVKNVSTNRENLKSLQKKNIYGTPVTFVNNKSILGFQKDKLKSILFDDYNYFS